MRLFIILALTFVVSPFAYGFDRTVKVGVLENAPIVFKGENGNWQGFSIEILEYIANQENWKLQYVECQWSECLQQLENALIDIQVSIAFSTDRSKKYAFTNESLLVNWGAVFARDGSGI